MKNETDFRDPVLTRTVVDQIASVAPSCDVKICHVCGTHEYVITHNGLRSLLPATVDVIAGPGCPVCVVPAAEVDEAIELALSGVTVISFGDVLRVAGSEISLQEARASGGDVRIVYGVGDATRIAKKEPEKEFVFFAIGFETTAPLTASEILSSPLKNLSFLVSHRLIPPAMELLLGIGDLHIDGFIAPGHVSTIIGLEPYNVFPRAYGMPTVVAGFEPLDILFAILMLLKQVQDGTPTLENEYFRSVLPKGNVKAQKLVEQVFEVVDGQWRGLGRIPLSALAIKNEFSSCDARKKYKLKPKSSRDILPGCLCHLVMIGKIKPPECTLFLKTCMPQSPKGPCMVSMEGTCRIWAAHGLRS